MTIFDQPISSVRFLFSCVCDPSSLMPERRTFHSFPLLVSWCFRNPVRRWLFLYSSSSCSRFHAGQVFVSITKMIHLQSACEWSTLPYRLCVSHRQHWLVSTLYLAADHHPTVSPSFPIRWNLQHHSPTDRVTVWLTIDFFRSRKLNLLVRIRSSYRNTADTPSDCFSLSLSLLFLANLFIILFWPIDTSSPSSSCLFPFEGNSMWMWVRQSGKVFPWLERRENK